MPQVSYAGLFPFCITPTDDGSLVGDGTWYPLGFTKEEVCALYWLNKSYSGSLSDSHTINYSAGDPSSYSIITGEQAYSYYDDPSTFVPTIETDFVCADVKNKPVVWFNTSDTSYVYLFGLEFVNSFGYSLTTNCYYYSGLYYPLMSFDGLAITSSRDFAVVFGGWTQAQVDLISVTATCTFLGRNVPVYWSGITPPTNDDGGTVTSGTVSCSLVITLNEQWPYNP